MENNSTAPTPASTGIRFGVILGVASAVFSFVQLALISDPESPIRWLSIVLMIGGIWLAHNSFKQQNGGFMSYGQGLSIGTITAGVAGVISSIFSYVYITFIDPEYLNRVMELTRTRLEMKGMDDEQIDQAMSMAAKFSSGGMMLVFGILGSLFFGFLLSLVIAAITKHNRPEFE